MKKKSIEKRKEMTAPRRGGKESVLYTERRVQSEARPSGRVQSRHGPEPCHLRSGEMGRRNH